MQNFRESLIALIPMLDKSKILWHGETYDDWDIIAEALYKAMVISPINYSQGLNYLHCKELVDYEFHYQNFSNNSFIIVKNNNTNELNSFYGFETKDTFFDYVNIAILDKNTLEFKEYLTIPFLNCSFALALNKDGKISEIEELDVDQ